MSKLGARTKSDHGDKSITPKGGKATNYAPEAKLNPNIHNHKATGYSKKGSK